MGPHAERLVLIVDDEPAIRSYLKEILRREEIQSLEAENATQALRLVRHLGDRIDLIITDIQMPGDMNGVDLAYSVHNSYPRLPIILISGGADKALGDFTLVRKPFTPELILEAVNRQIGKPVWRGEDPAPARLLPG